MYKSLFTPITINKLTLKNRIAYPSLGLLFSYDGHINDRYYHYFKEKAQGGAGMVTVGPVGFDKIGSGMVAMQLDCDEAIPSFEKMTNLIRNAGASPWLQLFHAGAYSYSKAIGVGDPVAPSAVYSKYSKTTPIELTADDISTLQKQFVAAAIRAKKAGFDGVEIIASAGYLITQFLSPVKNLRSDNYGGSFENRVRFPKELLQMLREALGADFPLSIRMAGNDFVTGSNTSGETPLIAKVYEDAGVNLINVTGGWHESNVPQLPMVVPRGAYSYLSLNIKKAVSIPVMASNRITTPDEADRIINEGMADMVNLGRVLIADPEWPNKSREGRSKEIRPCVACNQGCTDTLFGGMPVQCIFNARAGFEGERNIEKSLTPKNVMIVGAGPGGLEAAVRAAEAGHNVELYEKADDIGGQLWIAARPPHKGDIYTIIDYYRTMLKKYNIPVHLSSEVTIDLIKSKAPHHVIIAEGAEPAMPPIKGIGDPEVVSAWEILKDDPLTGKRIAVIGGGAVGLETAHFLAMKGTLSADALHFLFTYEAETPENLRNYTTRGSKEVTVFEMMPKAGTGIGRSTKWIVMDNLEKFGVAIITAAKVQSISNGEIVYELNGTLQTMKFDTVVNAVGSRSVKNLSVKMKDLDIPFTTVGDCIKPAQIGEAIHGAFLAVAALGK